jgi:glutathione S-transferase
VAGALFRGLALDLSKWPKTQAWLKRCWDRPAAQKAKAMRG